MSDINLQKDQYIILEIIPTHSNPEKGYIAQVSALKLHGIKLIDRFDYRVKESLIQNIDIKKMIQYDKKNFTYLDNKDEIIEKLKQWLEEYPILLIEETYTKKYLSNIENRKELIYPYLDMQYSLDIFDKIIKKYNLEPSNHLVDLLYEAIIQEGNNQE